MKFVTGLLRIKLRGCDFCGNLFIPKVNGVCCSHRCYTQRNEKRIAKGFVQKKNCFICGDIMYDTSKNHSMKHCKKCGYQRKISQNRDYFHSPKGLFMKKRRNAKRKEGLGWINIMDNPFPKEVEIVHHHINNLFTIPMPKRLHESKGGRERSEHRYECQKILKNLGLDISPFL